MLSSENILCSVESFESIAYWERINRSKLPENLKGVDTREIVVTSDSITRIVPIRKWTFLEFSTYLQELHTWGYPLQTVLLDLTYFGELPSLKDLLVTKLVVNPSSLGVIEYLNVIESFLKFPQSITLNQLVEKVPEISKDAMFSVKRERKRKKK